MRGRGKGRGRVLREDLAVGYVRVSTEEQLLGPEAQKIALARWAEGRKVTLVAVFEDRGVSGAAPLDRRPGLLAALTCLEDQRALYLVAAKRDRFARDVVVAAQLERLVERHGAQLVTADGTGDGESPEAVLMRRITDAIAEHERAMIRGRTRAALAVKRARGEKFGSTAPYGWRIAGKLLEQDPAEQPAIARAHELAARGLALREIAETLAAEGYPPRGRRWYANSVRRILVYAAEERERASKRGA